ncbi:MAG: NUDIX domain-containing protein [Pseudomonadota bacterium]
MPDITTEWRPRQELRVIALGLPFRTGKLLASAVTEDNGIVKGWRPLGGGVEFGESVEHALEREFAEELGAETRVLSRLAVFENLFEHHGAKGHEIVFAFEVALDEPGLASAEAFQMQDNGYVNNARWIPWTEFVEGRERLLPDGLLTLVEGLVPGGARA